MPEELIQLTTDPIRKIPQEILLIRMGENFYTKDHKEGSFTLDHAAADKILQEFDSRGIGDISVFFVKDRNSGKQTNVWVTKDNNSMYVMNVMDSWYPDRRYIDNLGSHHKKKKHPGRS